VTFTLLPAVDVAGGRAVELARGDATELAGGEPLETARRWQEEGAEWIHLVDLDAAFGRGNNADIFAHAVDHLDVAVELSGGIRDEASLARALATGCKRAILATAALDDLAWCARAIRAHGDRIAVALDVHISTGPDGSPSHQLAPRGAVLDRGGNLWETLEQLDGLGCRRYVVTDVGKDGMLSGPNLDLYRAVARATAAPVIASGGVASLQDLVAIAEAAKAGANVEGAIVGKALYAGRFTLAEAMEEMRRIG
jgi:phosphoribosylanthranilate isomerase